MVEMIPINIDELTRRGQYQESTPRPLHDAQIMNCREYLKIYLEPNPYKVGDLVTPRKGYGLYNEGEPHIVIEVFPRPITMWGRYDPRLVGFPELGQSIDIRVAALGNDNMTMVSWVNASFRYEPYLGGAEVAGSA
jgi:hypothetical protein